MNHVDMLKLRDTLSFSEEIRKFNEIEHEPLSNLIIEGGDVTNYGCTHFFTVRLDSELLRKRFHELLSLLDKEAYGTDRHADTYFPSWPGNRRFAGQV